jgi:hypothetical protein
MPLSMFLVAAQVTVYAGLRETAHRLGRKAEFDEHGELVSTIVLIGVLVALAIGVGVIITNAVTSKAQNISSNVGGAP